MRRGSFGCESAPGVALTRRKARQTAVSPFFDLSQNNLGEVTATDGGWGDGKFFGALLPRVHPPTFAGRTRHLTRTRRLSNRRRPHRSSPPPEALEHLRRADPVLRGVIDRLGPIEITTEPDLWWSLVDAIVSQQVSVHAAAAIIGRVAALGADGRPTPAEIAAADDEALRAAGLSRAKVRYVKDLAARWLDGSLRHERIPAMTDEEVVAELTRVKGIGVWTAEMILIFTLGRPDVLPVDDLGVRAAAQQLYGLAERPGRDALLRIGEPWRPWRTLASRYLWRSLGKTPVIVPDDPAAAKLTP